MNLLIPGGAGYIGSHLVKYVQENGHEAVVLDDFSTGHDWAINDCEILNVNLLDQEKLGTVTAVSGTQAIEADQEPPKKTSMVDKIVESVGSLEIFN